MRTNILGGGRVKQETATVLVLETTGWCRSLYYNDTYPIMSMPRLAPLKMANALLLQELLLISKSPVLLHYLDTIPVANTDR